MTEDIDKAYVGRQIKAARKMLKITQTDLGEKAGLPTSIISHFETGRRMPSLKNFYRIVEALGIPADDLLGRMV